MTDNEIMQALECCNSEKESLCFECPYHLCSPACLTRRNTDIIDLINRQKAEIDELKLICDKEKADRLYLVQANEALIAGQETLQKALAEKNAEIERLQADNSSMQSTLAKMSMGVEQAKAEAIKEFAEKVELEIVLPLPHRRELQNLVKEMVGESNV